MNHQRGFTLVELIVVIVLTGILASTVTVFFKPAIDSYFATQRRAALADTADTAVRRMAREIRSAVPNSILAVPETAISPQCIAFVPTIAGGRYRMAAHVEKDASGNVVPKEGTAADCESNTYKDASCSLDLSDTTAQKLGFDVLQISNSRAPVADDFVVIGNQEPDQVYLRTNVQKIKWLTGAGTYGIQRIVMKSEAGLNFSTVTGYDMGRFSVVPQTGSIVTFTCSNTGIDSTGQGTGKLYRVERQLDGTKPSVSECPATSGFPVLADKVESCKFIYSANDGTQQNGLVWMEITLTDDNERVSLAFGAHVSNVP